MRDSYSGHTFDLHDYTGISEQHTENRLPVGWEMVTRTRDSGIVKYARSPEGDLYIPHAGLTTVFAHEAKLKEARSLAEKAHDHTEWAEDQAYHPKENLSKRGRSDLRAEFVQEDAVAAWRLEGERLGMDVADEPVPMPHSHVPDQTPHITHAVSIALPHSTEIEEAHYMPMTDSFMDAIARFQGTTPPVTHI